jgi:DNA-binding IclR family transcriptional regulator
MTQPLNDANRALWLWLLNAGGYWTCEEIARATGYASINVFRAVHAMTRRGLIDQTDPAPGSFRKRYGITGLCLVPLGMRVAEVQAVD